MKHHHELITLARAANTPDKLLELCTAKISERGNAEYYKMLCRLMPEARIVEVNVSWLDFEDD